MYFPLAMSTPFPFFMTGVLLNLVCVFCFGVRLAVFSILSAMVAEIVFRVEPTLLNDFSQSISLWNITATGIVLAGYAMNKRWPAAR
jgi:hypothetical protein